jgi:hypothetical protein
MLKMLEELHKLIEDNKEMKEVIRDAYLLIYSDPNNWKEGADLLEDYMDGNNIDYNVY